MSYISEVDNFIFKDKQLGDLGLFIWIIPVALSIFFLLLCSSFFELINSLDESINNILFILFGSMIFLIISIWFLYESITALNIIQEIEINNHFIAVTFYFRKKGKIKFDEITSISLLEKTHISLENIAVFKLTSLVCKSKQKTINPI